MMQKVLYVLYESVISKAFIISYTNSFDLYIKLYSKNCLKLIQCLFTYPDFTYPDAHLSGQFRSQENSKKFQY